MDDPSFAAGRGKVNVGKIGIIHIGLVGFRLHGVEPADGRSVPVEKQMTGHRDVLHLPDQFVFRFRTGTRGEKTKRFTLVPIRRKPWSSGREKIASGFPIDKFRDRKERFRFDGDADVGVFPFQIHA